MKVVLGYCASFLLVASTLVLSGTQVVTEINLVDHSSKEERTVVAPVAVESFPDTSTYVLGAGSGIGHTADASDVKSDTGNARVHVVPGTDTAAPVSSSPFPSTVRRSERQVADSEEDIFEDWDEDELVPLFNLNSRESQLAQLHGLGAAEIATLTSWRQQKNRPRVVHEQQRHLSPHFRSQTSLAAKKRASSNHVQLSGSDGSQELWVALKRAPKNGGKKNSSGKKGKTPKVPVEEPTTTTPPPSPLEVPSGALSESMSEMPLLHPSIPNRGIEAGGASHGVYLGRPQSLQAGSSLSSASSASVASAAVQEGVGRIGRNLASQFLLRSPRENRQYDVPQIGCPPAEDGMERFACPSADRMGRYRCIDDHVLCDGFIDCPGAEDEDRQACMFYKTMKAHLDVVADALLRWVRGR